MMDVHAVHVGAEQVGQAVVRRRQRIERSQCQVRHVFVDLLRDERDVEEELRKVQSSGLNVLHAVKLAAVLTSSFSPRKGDQFFSMLETGNRRQHGEESGVSRIQCSLELVFANEICIGLTFSDRTAFGSTGNWAQS